MDEDAGNRKHGRSTILGKEMFLDEIVQIRLFRLDCSCEVYIHQSYIQVQGFRSIRMVCPG